MSEEQSPYNAKPEAMDMLVELAHHHRFRIVCATNAEPKGTILAVNPQMNYDLVRQAGIDLMAKGGKKNTLCGIELERCIYSYEGSVHPLGNMLPAAALLSRSEL